MPGGFRFGLCCPACTGEDCEASFCVQAWGCYHEPEGLEITFDFTDPDDVTTTQAVETDSTWGYPLGGYGYQAVACVTSPAGGEWTVDVSAPGHHTRTFTYSIVDCGSATRPVMLCPTSATVTVRLGGCLPRCHPGTTTVRILDHLDVERASVAVDWGTDDCPADPFAHCVDIVIDLSMDPPAAYDPADPLPCSFAEYWTVEVEPPAGSGVANASVEFFMSYCGAIPAVTLEPDADHVCVCGGAIPAELDYSDSQGSCTLTWTESGCDPASGGLYGGLWIGGYTFVCDNADMGPCSAYATGREIGPATVGVLIALQCYDAGSGLVGWRAFKIYNAVEGACGDFVPGRRYLSGVVDDLTGPDCTAYCYLRVQADSQPCADLPTVDTAGTWGGVYNATLKPLCTIDGFGPSADGPACLDGAFTVTG
jgi:hypothetical protein